ncbi:MAG: hypothetical protein MUE46_15280 [Xanthomonadales bacterium]|jgi:hypothetical protein|nr:hypothetical protein [Xanthomonadales bacterium]
MSQPPRPRLVLRAGFAGRKDLDPPAANRLREQLTRVYAVMGHTLASIAPGAPVEAGKEPPIARFYAESPPLLRLMTGLCEGADAIAADVLEQVRVCPDPGSSAEPSHCLQTELAAVLPFAVEDYRSSRPVAFQTQFDQQLERCAYVLELDGIYAKPEPDTPLASNRRARAYRAQSAFLLRQSDLLIAAANPDEPGKAGGTLESVRSALAFELPVIFLHTGTGAIYLIDPEADLPTALADPPTADWAAVLGQWVQQIVADPDLAKSGTTATGDTAKQHHATAPEPDIRLLEAYFDPDPLVALPMRWLAMARQQIWAALERRYSTRPKPRPDPPLEPYARYRKRATALNYHYSGQYRGAFVLNYTLAVIAVALATTSLMLLGIASHTPLGEQVAALFAAAPPTGVVSTTPRGWLLPTLIALALTKLALVVYISKSTHRANHERWNDRAVDMRYLAERLRALYYLPKLGSFQPPAVHPPQFAARVVRQSHIDWLCEAIIRSVSPADLPAAAPHQLQRPGLPDLPIRKRLRIDAVAELERIRDTWVAQQAIYHDRNAHGMHGMHHDMERWQQALSSIVVGIVLADLVLIAGKLAHKLHWISLPPLALDIAKYATPALILLSALIPAIVAALGGLRFQSECQRLAERSSVMRRLLAGTNPLKAWSDPDTAAQATALETASGRLRLVHQQIQRIRQEQQQPDNPASHAHLALRTAEAVAEEMIQEAAEWSVLYAKDLGEPG